MSKIIRNLSTPEARAWWAATERIAAQARDWPDSRKAGINVYANGQRPKVDPPEVPK